MVKEASIQYIDPNNNKGKFHNWKKNGYKLPYSGKDDDLIMEYLHDMEVGRNVTGHIKGGRSYSRMNSLRVRIPQLSQFFKEHYKKGLTELSRDDVTGLFHKLKTGIIKKKDGKPYKSYRDYIKDFKAFWHWYQKKQKRENNRIIEDITDDVSEGKKKYSDFVFFTIDQLQTMLDNTSNLKYKTMMLFMFDSCIRSPSELANVKVSDISPVPNSDRLFLSIREETSKTYGRKIKLMLSHKLVKRYIETNKLKPKDYLFKICPRVFNQYLKRLGKKTIGKEPTMYDFRHCGICYWLPRYKQEVALRYRTGHNDSKILDYYHGFLNMKDTIQEEDLEDADTRTKLENELEKERNAREILQEQLQAQANQISEIQRAMQVIKDSGANIETIREAIKIKKG